MRGRIRRVGAVWRRMLGGILSGLALAGAVLASSPEPEPRPAIVLDVDGPIGPATAGYVERGLDAARAQDAGLVVLRIDTPGGLDTAMREIIRDILASPVPVAAYVGPSGARAASAGTYILYASHVAAMAPGTNLGAATPVQIGGGGGLPFGGDKEDKEKDRQKDQDKEDAEDPGEPKDAMERKVVNDAVAYIRSLAELRGRDADWGEKAVRKGASLSAQAAHEKKVIDFLAGDIAELLEKADGKKVTVLGEERTLATKELKVAGIAPNWREQLLGVVTNPNVALILMMIGIYGIIFEFMSPGIIFPGVIGAISLLVGLFALNVLPVDYAGLALLLLGVAFMVAEAFAPSFGILGIGGVIAFMAGAVMMFEDVPGFELSWTVLLAVTGASVAFLVVALAMVVRSRGRRVVTGSEGLIGSTGQVLVWADGRGHVHVQGERWQARSAAPLAPGQTVRVTGREAFLLRVEPAGGTGEAPPSANQRERSMP